MLNCVQVIHKEGIVHRDLKPDNFLSVNGRLKLIDLGVASKLEENATHAMCDGGGHGTINYISPERLMPETEGYKIGFKADVWALGCMLYKMVYHKLPFERIRDKTKKLLVKLRFLNATMIHNILLIIRIYLINSICKVDSAKVEFLSLFSFL